MSQIDLLKEKRTEILTIAAKYGAHNVRVFGSVARGDAGQTTGFGGSATTVNQAHPEPKSPDSFRKRRAVLRAQGETRTWRGRD